MRLAKSPTPIAAHTRRYQEVHLGIVAVSAFASFVFIMVGTSDVENMHRYYGIAWPLYPGIILFLVMVTLLVLRNACTFEPSNVHYISGYGRYKSVSLSEVVSNYYNIKNDRIHELATELMNDIEAAAFAMRGTTPSDEEERAMMHRYTAMDELYKTDVKLRQELRFSRTMNTSVVDSVRHELDVQKELTSGS